MIKGQIAVAQALPAIAKPIESPILKRQQIASHAVRKLGAEPLSIPLAEFNAMIQRELKENAELIRKAGIKAN